MSPPAPPVTLPVTLSAVDAYFPDREVTVDDVLDDHGLSAAQLRVFRRIHGLDRMRLDPDLPLIDLLLPAARDALAAAGGPERVRHVLYAHAVPQVAPAGTDTARLLADALGLAHADAFAVVHHNCAQALVALDLAADLLRAEGTEGDSALIISGERVFTPLIQLDYGLGQLLADGAAACLLTLGGSGDVIRSHAVHSDPRPAGEGEQTGETGVRHLVATMLRAVADAGLVLDDIDLVLPHNVNRTFWRQAAKALGIPTDKVFLENIPRYSHCFSADPLINYKTLDDGDRLRPGGNYLMAAVGVGGSYAATVLTRPPRPLATAGDRPSEGSQP
ncbi:3-oxoacyl-ACP synthase III family protein [Streptomyces spectabilis]|uniref:3-oxoacyl-ACP synthase n=1 Tax=Streptomyces spectabilis TaxID=68270 RepID=A0A5P2X4I7_STRST|nr:3-oxoacyl-[acyl-carrier-protein] synthase III C-terminal domain-containing protein [Streptomyces spectabilis]MBB5108892.1 3-oxoacyl-[acyl-carrier-protein] synthase-3 [Streptomyces spectabilis]MCI3899814.1 3-oxoacyl-ACP synthase [Streptomyces spectabilis]QEV57476.1 3-oxoacyl-ACP synthase [Streptomyces spectabilis]GGV42756.1 3-oxoacyl-ACP synthase [Streptomyces spectabilis]